MSNRERKPKKSAEELVRDMAVRHGVTFNWISEQEAAEYFIDRNNFLRTASYRKNYYKHEDGKRKEEYIGLDFLALIELSTIDMYLRRYLLRMCIDVEHALKVRLIADIEKDTDQDGYQIVSDFLKSNESIKKSIAGKEGTIFAGDLVSKYFTVGGDRPDKLLKNVDCPAWVLVELLSFGAFIRFANFYYEEKKVYNPLYNTAILNSIRSLRNACAHNNCILNDLKRTANTTPAKILTDFVSEHGIKKDSRKRNLSTRPILEITSLLYEYSLAVSSKVRASGLEELRTFVNTRAIEKKDILSSNTLLVSRYTFLKSLLDNLV